MALGSTKIIDLALLIVRWGLEGLASMIRSMFRKRCQDKKLREKNR